MLSQYWSLWEAMLLWFLERVDYSAMGTGLLWAQWWKTGQSSSCECSAKSRISQSLEACGSGVAISARSNIAGLDNLSPEPSAPCHPSSPPQNNRPLLKQRYPISTRCGWHEPLQIKSYQVSNCTESISTSSLLTQVPALPQALKRATICLSKVGTSKARWSWYVSSSPRRWWDGSLLPTAICNGDESPAICWSHHFVTCWQTSLQGGGILSHWRDCFPFIKWEQSCMALQWAVLWQLLSGLGPSRNLNSGNFGNEWETRSWPLGALQAWKLLPYFSQLPKLVQ